MTDKKSPDLEDEENREGVRPADEEMLHWFEMLCMWLEIDSYAEPYTLKELHSKMSELAGDDSVYSLKRLKQKLQERYENKSYYRYSQYNWGLDTQTIKNIPPNSCQVWLKTE